MSMISLFQKEESVKVRVVVLCRLILYKKSALEITSYLAMWCGTLRVCRSSVTSYCCAHCVLSILCSLCILHSSITTLLHTPHTTLYLITHLNIHKLIRVKSTIKGH
jgi:hypothetical protein